MPSGGSGTRTGVCAVIHHKAFLFCTPLAHLLARRPVLQLLLRHGPVPDVVVGEERARRGAAVRVVLRVERAPPEVRVVQEVGRDVQVGELAVGIVDVEGATVLRAKGKGGYAVHYKSNI